MTNLKSIRIISLLMAMLMFLTSIGFSIDVHFCQGNLKHFSVFTDAKSCHEMTMYQSCNANKTGCKSLFSTNEASLASCYKDCCSNKKIEITPNDDTQICVPPSHNSSSFQFISQHLNSFLQGWAIDVVDLKPYQHYEPPFLNKNIFVFIQSFLL